jgi:signal transduction histidine kinase
MAQGHVLLFEKHLRRHGQTICMSLKIRLALLLGVLLVAFMATLQVLHWVERRQAENLLNESVKSNELAIQRWIDLTNQPLQRFAQDYSRWPELVDFLHQPNAGWADSNLRSALPNYEAHALWVLDGNGHQIYSARATAGPQLPSPVNATGLAQLGAKQEITPFFTESRDGLLEIWSQPIRTSASDSTPVGWLLVARLWNHRHVATLSHLTEATILLAPAGEPPATGRPAAELRLPLPDLTGTPLRQLVARFALPDFSDTATGDVLAARLFVVFGLLLIAAVWLSLQQWVLRPLSTIAESLSREDPSKIHRLRNEKTELGRVAQLVESSFQQKTALQHEVAERTRAEAALRDSETQLRHSLDLRTRLARDLHDGVIQSIYAAGLGLESAVSQMEQDPSGARLRLQLCRKGLNDVIREVRGFINGLEPEQMQQLGFAHELESLARTMQALWPVSITLELNTRLARQLNAIQQVHSLQIVRESISNALRHGEAKSVHIALSPRDGGGSLTVRDDGCGFDPGQRTGEGSGLLNLASRAREMSGSLQLESSPGRGTTVTITFPVAHSAP